ncbi:Inner membrane protein translocase component YidC, long form [Fulvivirga imtechensis AK7]|uniref:Membrane protein insertase YidC n=1 Tax=Fulvivirga imtechensis AK7 TaxID=1237149 RepID=L8JMC3_9BACT|nr:membrane protein insertase YidC [Fulvivirga imtechensis]ELR68674.1 Inner membrane protein translocase component YidC, long form [Fulvivirga imtechensis AK7]
MDRNQATGLILIALMVMLYFYFFAPKPEPVEEHQKDTTELVEEGTVESVIDQYTPAVAEDSAQQAFNQQKYGVFAKGASGKKEDITIENELVKISLTNKGGKVNKVELKNFTTYYGEPLILLDGESNNFSLLVNNIGRQLNIYDLYYTPAQRTEGDTTVITFNLDIAPGQSVKHIYKLGKETYQLSYQLKIEGLDQYISKENLIYTWDDRLKTQEKDLTMSRNNSTINYYTLRDGFDGLAERSTDVEEETIEEPIKWVAIKQRFFVSGIIAQNSFNKGRLKTSVDPADLSTVKTAQVVLSLPYEDIKSGKGNYTYYFGPNDYHILNDVADDFENNLDLGWPPMKWINRWVIIPLFDLLGNFISNYGIIIIVMVLLIKLVLSPLSYKSYLSMAKMKVLKPELDEIKEKHSEDLTKAQQEQMKLYQKVGVSPLSGCIPMLLQMPILFAMFYFFPQSIELRGESFLWAEDLSTYDSILNLPFTIPFYGDHVSLFVLLMTLSTILYTWSNQQVSTVQGPMKTFSYLMPVIFMFVLNSYPAALSFYYFVSNLVTFGQQALIRRFVDEEKIRVILEENKKKNVNKKKSKFQQRLEEAMKASQAKGKK